AREPRWRPAIREGPRASRPESGRGTVAGQGVCPDAWLDKSERLAHTRPTARDEPLRRAARLAAAERYRASRRSRASVRALAAAVHAAEPSAQREVRLEGDVAGAEPVSPGAGWKTEGEPDVERERAGAEVEEGVTEPELAILEAAHRGLAREIAHAIRELDDRLHTVGDAVLDLRPHGRAALVRKAEVTRRERGLELVLVLDVDRARERELLRDDRHPLRTACGRCQQQREAGDAGCDRGRPRGDH